MNPWTVRTRALLFILTLVSAIFSLPLQAQNKQPDNALLWKVTGNSLLKPSFLFGTIHLQDKRVFNFSDSLYSFLQRVDGFAMEIHPDSVVSALMANEDEAMQDKLLKKHLKKDDFDQLRRKLKKDLGIDADGLTLKDAYMLKDHLSKPAPRADDMPTFVDAYLFGVARNQGKEIVGLEKAADQMKMLDDIRGEFNAKAIIKGLKKEKSLIERLVQLYIREDLKSIHELMSYLPDDTENKLLTARNHLMVSKMDSLIRAKSFVVAVGTAHLPGEKGMIELLRKKGYTVEPVFTTSRTHANDYAIKAVQINKWIEVKEPKLGYSIRMPGKPSPMSMLNGGMKMNMYMDLTSMKLYYAAFVIPAINVNTHNADSILQAMCANTMTSSKGKAISSKRFNKDGFEGIDFVYKQAAENMHVRVQALAKDKRVYLVGFGAPKLEELSGKESVDFFDAFKIEDMSSQAWETHTFNDYFFSISFPEQPKMVPLAVADSSIRSVQFNSMDNNKGSYYGLTVVTTNPGFAVPDDSAYFASAVERLKENIEMHSLSQSDTLFQGFHAKRVKASLKENLWLNALMVNRGNRIYTLMVICNKADSSTDGVTDFFSSFNFTNYPKLQWKEKDLAEHSFIVPVTGTFSKIDFFDTDEDSATYR
ncbi:MAG: TraB/GumN family protein, partial [Chitinophagaceae bacterium]